MSNVEWTIYYADESTFDSTDGEPEDAPSFGILCIVFPDPYVGRLVMNGWDWYYYHPEEKNWWGADIHGLLDTLLWNRPFRALKQGRNVSRKVWETVLMRSVDDPDFPIKEGRTKRERPFQVT